MNFSTLNTIGITTGIAAAIIGGMLGASTAKAADFRLFDPSTREAMRVMMDGQNIPAECRDASLANFDLILPFGERLEGFDKLTGNAKAREAGKLATELRQLKPALADGLDRLSEACADVDNFNTDADALNEGVDAMIDGFDAVANPPSMLWSVGSGLVGGIWWLITEQFKWLAAGFILFGGLAAIGVILSGLGWLASRLFGRA